MKLQCFGQLVIGPPGSGKTTYCKEMHEFLSKVGRKVSIINIDPANDNAEYVSSLDISELITVEDAMEHMKLGPNGSLVYCMEYLEKNLEWFVDKLKDLNGHYLLFDCPGQVELYTHHESLKRVMDKLTNIGIHMCAVHLVDTHYCNDAGKFISSLLLSLCAMLQIALPHVNVLSKVDMLSQYGNKIPFGLDYYTEVLDLNYLLDSIQEDPFLKKYVKLNSALISVVEDYGLVSFIPLNVKDKRQLLKIKRAVDKANGYLFNAAEEKNIQSLLACAVQGESEHDRIGLDRDLYSCGSSSMDFN